MRKILIFCLPVILCLPAIRTSSSVAAATREESEVATDSCGYEMVTEIHIVTPAESYYWDMGRQHPVDDALEGDDYQAIVDSANVVLAIFPDDVYSKKIRSYGEFMLEDYENSTKDILEVGCSSLFDETFWDIVHANIGNDPALVKRHLTPYISAYMAAPDPKNADDCTKYYLDLLAECELNLNDFPSAYKTSMIAVEIENGDVDSVNRLGRIYMRCGLPEKAVELYAPYMEPVEYAPSNMFINYVLALRNAGRSEEAYKLFEKILKEDLTEGYRLKMELEYAIMLAANGEYEKAIKKYDLVEKALIDALGTEDEDYSDSPDLVEVYLRRGITKKVMGQDEAGELDIMKSLALSMDGASPVALAWIGRNDLLNEWLEESGLGLDAAPIYSIMGENEKALELLKQQFDQYINTPDNMEYDLNYLNLRKTPEYKELVKGFKPLDLN